MCAAASGRKTHPSATGSVFHIGGQLSPRALERGSSSESVRKVRRALDDCRTTVSELNNLVALYRELVISIGETATDCASVRGEMRRTRAGACETARAAQRSLCVIPGPEDGEIPLDICRLFIQLQCCLEMFITEMLKAACLLSSLQMYRRGREDMELKVEIKADESSDTPILQESSSLPTDGWWLVGVDIKNTERDMKQMKNLLSKLREIMPSPLKNQATDQTEEEPHLQVLLSR
ncbi:regulator of G-protein signaling 7-binding protein B-like isoform X2 [Brienomyrus brachyistius]|uniref:regulator of G-protein signaling 7-binding protein B-like isoform X2 n=1 Tax=Brienomyrus brachyistius TaxID=42636 RepID=UPI0020B1F6F4|nr:regulator of G-protein signaling 7-binding protein B-like isoform X2 [Brienomyrus brachyistius]